MINEIVGFESLHQHSCYSTLDGHSFPEDMAKRWKNYGDYLSISDHGMMAAIPRQIKACEASGKPDDTHKDKKLTPIFASELYVNSIQPEYSSEKEFDEFKKSLSPEELKKLRTSYHILAVAYNDVGYSNLVTLSSLAWTNGYYYRPRVNHKQLLQYKEGIVFTSCCYMGEIGQAFDIGGEDAAFAMIEKYMAMFGENFYLEFMLLDFSKQKPYNAFIMKAHAKYHVPLLVTLDSHYVNEEDSKYQRRMLMMQTKRTMKDIERIIQEQGGQDLFELQDTNLWMKTEEELNKKWESDYSNIVDYELFKQAKINTVELCRKAGGVKLDRTLKLPTIENANDKLKELTIKGFIKLGLPKTKEYQNRISEELSLFFRKDFSSYFLIAKEAVNEAKRFYKELTGNANACGPGRGSSCGSLVCYCLGLTKINPIKHGLLFSRFLSEARNDLPDLDLDFEELSAAHLKKTWVVNRFGRDYAVNIGTYTTFALKNSLLDSARIFDKDKNEIQAITKNIAAKDEEGKEMTWDSALDLYPELKKYCDDNFEVADTAKNLLHRVKNTGVHAGGVIISSKPINKFVPLIKGKDGAFVSAWAEGLSTQDLGPMGFVKYDFLVITNLEQINYTCELIRKRHGINSMWSVDGEENWTDDGFIEDPKALAMANEGDLKGIFQFDSEGIRNLVKKGGVSSFGDLAAYTAIFRPAILKMKVDDSYTNRKKGVEQYELHSILKPVLGETQGLMLYQEQVAKILNIVGEIPLKDCETLRKAISKKKNEYFEPYKKQFIENGQKILGYTEEQMLLLWSQVEAFSGYGFNKSHSIAYTFISSILLYLKAHYPLEFYTGLLHFEKDADKIKEYKLDADKHEIPVKSLDLNKSKVNFDIVDEKIYCGFSNIKGIGEAISEKAVNNQPYVSIEDFLDRFGTEEAVVKALIGLRMFKGSPVDLYKYYKWRKETKTKLAAKKKRFEESCKKFELELGNVSEELKGKIEEKLQKRIEKYESGAKIDKMPSFEDFMQTGEEVKVEEKILKLLEDDVACEQQFYGFIWHHPISKSPDYEGNRTFEMFRDRGHSIDYVEVMVMSIAKQTSKKNKDVIYWLLKIEDANGEEFFMQVWEDDWNRFSEELTVGALAKIKVKAPDKGWNRYTLYAPKKWPKWEYDKIVPKDRKYDTRVVILRKG